MSQSQKLLALLIDGDNVSSKQIQEILDKASAAGKLLIKRVYVNKASMAQWESVINEHSLTPSWVSNNTTNKNSVDIALVVDAMTLLYERPDLTGFCLVSSDSDFTVLARHILTKDKYVLGLGQASTPQAFRNACSKFVNLNAVTGAPPVVKKVEPPKPVVTKPTQPPVKPVAKPAAKPVIKQIDRSPEMEIGRMEHAYDHAAYERDRGDKDGWVHLSEVRNSLKALYPNYNPLIYKGEKISQLKKVIQRMMLDYPSSFEIKNINLAAHVRVKPNKSSKS